MAKKANVRSQEIPPIFEIQILRVEQVAEMLQFSKWTVYKLAKQKDFPSYKKGKTRFFMRHEILNWMQKGAA